MIMIRICRLGAMLTVVCLPFLKVVPAYAVDLPAVQIAALDQPRVNGQLRGEPPMAPLYGIILSEAFTASLDTGSSGIVINNFRAADLGIGHAMFNGEDVVYLDAGSTGAATFTVSELLNLEIASFEASTPVTSYPHVTGPARVQIAEPDFLFDGFDINVVGMPAMKCKFVVLDPKPTNTFTPENPYAYMNTFVYNPWTPFDAGNAADPGIPPTSHHVRLSYADFNGFGTLTTSPSGYSPPDTLGPTLAPNPFIGPDPVTLLEGGTDDTPGITISFDGEVATGSFLLDTGAASSFISKAMAAGLNVRYVAGTEGTATPQLESFDPDNPGDPGVVLPGTFTTDITGVSGTQTVAGFFLDWVLLPTQEAADPYDSADSDNLKFLGGPVLVADISTTNGVDTITLEGIFGMNFISASTDPATFPSSDIVPTPFDWAVFDAPGGTLGLHVAGFPYPPARVPADGDINLDGVVNAADVALAFKALLSGSGTLTDEQVAHADVAPKGECGPIPDGAFNLGDVLVLMRMALDEFDGRNPIISDI